MKDYEFTTSIQGLSVTITIIAKSQKEAANRVYQLVRNPINNLILDEKGRTLK